MQTNKIMLPGEPVWMQLRNGKVAYEEEFHVSPKYFSIASDDYLALCGELGQYPVKEYAGVKIHILWEPTECRFAVA